MMNTPHASATTAIGELLRQIAARSAPADRSPLLHLGELTLPDTAPTPLPLTAESTVAWRALLGETGLAWQAEALNIARRTVGLALVAPAPIGPATLLLLIAEQIRLQTAGTLLLVVDQAMLPDVLNTIRNIDALLGGGFPHLLIDERTRPPRRLPPVLVLTPDILHNRILRSHDRGWAHLWPTLRGIAVPAIDQLPGAAIGHLRWLLRRVARLRPIARPLPLYTSLRPLADVDEAVRALTDYPPPLVLANASRVPLTWAIWRGAEQPVETLLNLATELRKAGITVHLDGCDDLARALLAQVGAERGIPLAPWSGAPANAVALLGVPDAGTVAALASSGYRTVVIVHDGSVIAQVGADQPALLTPATPLIWPDAATNIYVTNAHLRCAAEEQPLQRGEVEEWDVMAFVERLEAKGRLAHLPGAVDTWQPVAAPGHDRDDYALLHPASASGAPVPVLNESGVQLAQIDGAFLERRLYPGASVAGAQVSGWNDDGAVVVRFGHGTRSLPEHRVQVTVRDQTMQRTLDGGRADAPLQLGKVVADEEITARCTVMKDGSIRRVPFEPPLRIQWSAPALWLPTAQTAGRLGMMLTGVLPLLLRCAADDLVACVDGATLYLVEAHPGGRGIVEHLYVQFESLLHLAGVAARTLKADPLWQPYAEADLAWMQAILMPLAEPLRPDRQPDVAPTARPPVERRTRASMIATPSELETRRRRRKPQPTAALGRRATPPTPAPEPENAPVMPAQPMRLPAQPPAPPQTSAPPRQNVRREAPPPPTEKRPQAPRPIRRRSGQQRAPQSASASRSSDQTSRREIAQPTPQRTPLPATPRVPEPSPQRTALPQTQSTPPPLRTPLQAPEPSSQRTVPARREPPPLERPPFQERQQAPKVEATSDPNALLAKARRLREQREAELRREQAAHRQPPAQRSFSIADDSSEDGESRFKPGDRVFCVPYGEGEVRKSRVRDGRELLLVAFPELGELRIDPVVNAVRLIEAPQSPDVDEDQT